jgi:hypothetical protein
VTDAGRLENDIPGQEIGDPFVRVKEYEQQEKQQAREPEKGKGI